MSQASIWVTWLVKRLDLWHSAILGHVELISL